MKPELFANSDLFAVLMMDVPLLVMTEPIATVIWLLLVFGLCVLLSTSDGRKRWIGRGMLAAMLVAIVVGVVAAWADSV